MKKYKKLITSILIIALLGLSVFMGFSVAIDSTKVKWLAIGDSITAGLLNDDTSYVDIIEDEYSNLKVYKQGHSGYWLYDIYETFGKKFPKDVDIVTVFAGTNDFNGNNPIGNISDSEPGTFYGDTNTFMTQIKEKYPDADIYFFTPTTRGEYTGGRDDVVVYELVNGNDDTLEEYVNAMLACGKKNGVTVIDLYHDFVINDDNKDEYLVDGLHPNMAGHELIAKYFDEQIFSKLNLQ